MLQLALLAYLKRGDSGFCMPGRGGAAGRGRDWVHQDLLLEAQSYPPVVPASSCVLRCRAHFRLSLFSRGPLAPTSE